MRFDILATALLLAGSLQATAFGQHLPGTEPLTEKADFARVMLDGLDRWLDRETARAYEKRRQRVAADAPNLEAKRQKLRKLIGLIDTRLPPAGFEKTAKLIETDRFTAYAIRWTVLHGITGEGLLLEPKEPAQANVVAIPDSEQTPEQIAGLAEGLSPDNQFACRLVEVGCRVVIPVLIDRNDAWSGNPTIGRMTNQSHREFIWRMSYEMGRHIIGYELQRVLGAVDQFAKDSPKMPIGVMGYRDGGMLAMYAAALDERVTACCICGSFGPQEKMANDPIDRDVWNRLREFGDAEIVQLICPRKVILARTIGVSTKENKAEKGRGGAAPGRLTDPILAEFQRETQAALDLAKAGAHQIKIMDLTASPPMGVLPQIVPIRGLSDELVHELVGQLRGKVLKEGADSQKTGPIEFDPQPRQKRQFDELVAFTQKLLPEAARKRQETVWNKLDTTSLEAFKKSQEPLREMFLNDIVGNMPDPTDKIKPRTRLILETPKWKGYEVVLDVFDDVISYGILLVPNDIKPGERRPCVVCQHGLEGRPTDVVDPTQKTRYYNSFGAQLADKGYVVFAPQAPYIFKNEFRQVVRKMHPLGYNLYAVIVRQHQQILRFLGDLPFVDGRRIAYYGLSYGGKVAMRIPAVLLGYCAVICSGDFNEWIWKNITLDWGGSYMFTGEYDMYEFNLGNTFNYAEMSALIAPRPFMVERGHDDGVGLDEYVAFEFAKTRRLYSRLKISDRTEIEFFAGGHEIHGVGTFAFLARHLQWPRGDLR